MANDNDALVPEIWAKFGLLLLENNMVAGQLVHRDFESELASFGDTVNTRKPSAFKAKRKTDTDSVTVQDSTLTNIPVKLDMHPHVSFLIRDGEESLAFQSLIDLHLDPAMKAMAEHIDACVVGQVGQYLGNAGGRLGGLSSTNYQAYLTEVAEKLDVDKVPNAGRQLIIPPSMKRLLLQNQTLVGADQRGDQGTALREASLGRIYGFDHFMAQNMASVSGADVRTAAINLAAGYAKGYAGAMTIDGIAAPVIANGTWIKLGGFPYQVTAHAETAGATTSITVTPALRVAAADNDVITVYTPGAVNLAAGYAAGYAKDIVIDGFTTFPKVGQIVTFKLADTANIYSIIQADSAAGTILLDRPLAAALVDNDPVNIGPDGDYGFAFVREALTLVVRPLKLPRPGAGAVAGSASHGGFSIRVVITYDGDKQGHLVTLDCLMGIKVLDVDRGAVLLG